MSVIRRKQNRTHKNVSINSLDYFVIASTGGSVLEGAGCHNKDRAAGGTTSGWLTIYPTANSRSDCLPRMRREKCNAKKEVYKAKIFFDEINNVNCN